MLVCNKIHKIKGNIIKVIAIGPCLGELVHILKADGSFNMGVVICLDYNCVLIQVCQGTLGLSTTDRVMFMGESFKVAMSDAILNRRFNGLGKAIDGGTDINVDLQEVSTPSYNPMSRTVPDEMIRTNIPMIDVFNCLIKSQKIPVFSTSGEPFNELLLRIARQSMVDIIVIAGMSLRFEVYRLFLDYIYKEDKKDTIMFTHQAIDPIVECMFVPDLALSAARHFAEKGKDVLVIMSDMSAFADALKEIAIMMDVLPSNRGYPGSLYSDLASRYEQAVSLKDGGSVTILSATTMPGNDVTHPIPDNTGYITEGQFYLTNGKIEPFGSLSRLKQLIVGVHSRADHGHLANAMVRIYSESITARERLAMGFSLSNKDKRLVGYADAFEKELMDWKLSITLEDALDLGWSLLRKFFSKEETGIKEQILKEFWFVG